MSDYISHICICLCLIVRLPSRNLWYICLRMFRKPSLMSWRGYMLLRACCIYRKLLWFFTFLHRELLLKNLPVNILSMTEGWRSSKAYQIVESFSFSYVTLFAAEGVSSSWRVAIIYMKNSWQSCWMTGENFPMISYLIYSGDKTGALYLFKFCIRRL